MGRGLSVAIESVKTGGTPLIVVRPKKYGTWAWTNRPPRGLLLQGGPGLTHDYFQCFKDFFSKPASNSITMISLVVFAQRIVAIRISGLWNATE